MRSILAAIAVFAALALAAPADAQQAGADTSNVGREATGVDAPAGEGQPGAVDPQGQGDEGLTTRQGIEGETTTDTGADAATTAETDADVAGGAMPTTASDLPVVLTMGLVLAGFGLALRYGRSRV
jgi:hypothetical protein